MTKIDRVNIRPGVSMLSVLPHLNYKPWFALGEFVDNALQSFLSRKGDIREVEGRRFALSVDIDIDHSAQRIVIRDNAGGIEQETFPRAFRPAEVPADASGLSEFGMGMKSAAAWFAPRWSVRTKALGENVERTVRFDIDKIVKDTIEELEVHSRAVSADQHYTEIVLDDVRKMPQKRTLAKICDHLSSIYRVFTRRGDMMLSLNGEALTFDDPEILSAHYWKRKSEPARLWRKEMRIELSGGRRAEGFVAIRAKGSTSRAGLALLRRDRLIEGSADEAYRPPEIFGATNSFVYQRVFGELNLIGFKVSHTKDGIRWDESEEEFVSKLKTALSTPDLPLLDQAQNWRSTETARENRPHAQKAIKEMQEEMPINKVASALEKVQAHQSGEPSRQELPQQRMQTKEDDVAQRFDLDVLGARWEIDLALDYKDATCDWLRISDQATHGPGGTRRIGVRLAMLHPFSQRFFAKADADQIQGIARLAIGLVLSETIARDGGVKLAGRIRTSLNELLRLALSA
ncbi:ATP-binding protein [Mesorhizobium abyssinicae]|uniref:ATP-binding protein n=1 Tax=Mesorhizobium abyssinicae TaxID=1209958 RepID=A0ABU5AVY1_9HYPH|nr:ATP-binding protein [Mesorhizobium abyssinicae]MDX8541479.1 ATP-binding protein [Mesorhizobium abyssinicae]